MAPIVTTDVFRPVQAESIYRVETRGSNTGLQVNPEKPHMRAVKCVCSWPITAAVRHSRWSYQVKRVCATLSHAQSSHCGFFLPKQDKLLGHRQVPVTVFI